MENASRALIIIGWAFIAIVILSILVYVFTTFGSFSRSMHKEIEEKEISIYNERFLKCSGKIDITAQEIVSLVAYARKITEKELISSEITDIEIENIYNNSQEFTHIFLKQDPNNNNMLERFSPKFNGGRNYRDSIEFYNILQKFIKENNTKYFCCNVKKVKVKDKHIQIIPKNISNNLLGNSDITVSKKTKKVYKIVFSETSKLKDIPADFNMKNRSIYIANMEG